MAIEQNRIEAAARARYERAMALFPETSRVAWSDMHPDGRAFLMMEMEQDIAAAYPELASDPPTGWVAPWEATKAMRVALVEASYEEIIEGTTIKRLRERTFAAMRDAHLRAAARDAHLKEQGHA